MKYLLVVMGAVSGVTQPNKMVSSSTITPTGKWIPERYSTGDDD